MEPVRYAKNGDVHLAYQVVGEGDVDIVCVPGWFSDLETGWDVPGLGWFLRQLSRMGRLILFDKRGMGQSDPVVGDRFPSFEERSEDVVAVMDAVGCERAAVVGVSEGGTQALLTAARHPDRVSSVVAISSWVRMIERPEEPGFGLSREQLHAFVSRALEHWGSGRDVAVFAPSRVEDSLFVERWARFQRRAATPSALEGYGRALEALDITGELAKIDVPVLLLHSTGDRMVPLDQFRYLAAHLDTARAVELGGGDHLPFFENPELLVEELEGHLLGHARPEPTERRFAAVLFTDIVGSTDRAAGSGDRVWRSLLDSYEEVVERVVDEHGGRVVKSTGDGTLATFGDPQAALLAARALHLEAHPLGLELRAGLHCGQIELRGDDVGGIAVHIAARVNGVADPGTTVVSSTVRDVLLGSRFALAPHGTHTLKGVPGRWQLFRLTAA